MLEAGTHKGLGPYDAVEINKVERQRNAVVVLELFDEMHLLEQPMRGALRLDCLEGARHLHDSAAQCGAAARYVRMVGAVSAKPAGTCAVSMFTRKIVVRKV
eukprot:452212-Prymnesium_polylepis.2